MNAENSSHCSIQWDAVKGSFAWDGSLRDIYVRSTSVEDWARIIQVLRTCFNTSFLIDGASYPMADDVDELLSIRASRNPELRVMVGSMTVVTHFFSREKVDFDIDPREVRSEVEFGALLSFIRKIGDTTKKQVLLTEENCPDAEIIRYEPRTQQFTCMAEESKSTHLSELS